MKKELLKVRILLSLELIMSVLYLVAGIFCFWLVKNYYTEPRLIYSHYESGDGYSSGSEIYVGEPIGVYVFSSLLIVFSIFLIYALLVQIIKPIKFYNLISISSVLFIYNSIFGIIFLSISIDYLIFTFKNHPSFYPNHNPLFAPNFYIFISIFTIVVGIGILGYIEGRKFLKILKEKELWRGEEFFGLKTKPIDRYLIEVETFIFGLTKKEKNQIINELRSHILEKADEIVKKENKKPEEVIEGILTNFGNPKEIAKEYSKIEKKDRKILVFSTIAIVISIFLLYLTYNYFESIYRVINSSFEVNEIFFVYSSLIFIFGSLLIIFVYFNLRKKVKIKHYNKIFIILFIICLIFAYIFGTNLYNEDFMENIQKERKNYSSIGQGIVVDSEENVHIVYTDDRNYDNNYMLSIIKYDLLYTKIDKNGNEVIKNKIILKEIQPIKFSIYIDKKDNLHIIYMSFDFKFNYLKLNNNGEILIENKELAGLSYPYTFIPEEENITIYSLKYISSIEKQALISYKFDKYGNSIDAKLIYTFEETFPKSQILIDNYGNFHFFGNVMHFTEMFVGGVNYTKISKNGEVLVNQTKIGDRNDRMLGSNLYRNVAIDGENLYGLISFHSGNSEENINFIKLNNSGKILVNKTLTKEILVGNEYEGYPIIFIEDYVYIIYSKEETHYMKLTKNGEIIFNKKISDDYGYYVFVKNDNLHILNMRDYFNEKGKIRTSEIHYYKVDANGNVIDIKEISLIFRNIYGTQQLTITLIIDIAIIVSVFILLQRRLFK